VPLYQPGVRKFGKYSKEEFVCYKEKEEEQCTSQGIPSSIIQHVRQEIKETKERDRMELEARRKERNKRMFNNKSVKDNTGHYEIETPVSQSLFNRNEPSFLSGRSPFPRGGTEAGVEGDWCQQVKM
jgi:hypothetical protein